MRNEKVGREGKNKDKSTSERSEIHRRKEEDKKKKEERNS